MRNFIISFFLVISYNISVNAQPQTTSKISLHLLTGYSEGAKQVIAAGPPVIKILDLHEPMLQAMRDYKAAWPQGKVVLRIYTTPTPLSVNPEEAADEYFFNCLWPPIERISIEDRALIDYLEGPNECEQYPAWQSVETATWYAKFWERLCALIADKGLHPCVGSIPVGNPPGDPDEVAAKFTAFIPALKMAQGYDGAWSYHSYSLVYGTDIGEELWTSLRYRKLHKVLEEQAPELVNLPLILTESGIDKGGNAKLDGFQARGTVEQYQQWLQWYDTELQKDEYVLGSTLFQSGDFSGWTSFETEPVTGWLAQHIKNFRSHAQKSDIQ